jgi:hypothetical protein
MRDEEFKELQRTLNSKNFEEFKVLVDCFDGLTFLCNKTSSGFCLFLAPIPHPLLLEGLGMGRLVQQCSVFRRDCIS